MIIIINFYVHAIITSTSFIRSIKTAAIFAKDDLSREAYYISSSLQCISDIMSLRLSGSQFTDAVYAMNYVRVYSSPNGETIKSSTTTLLRDLR